MTQPMTAKMRRRKRRKKKRPHLRVGLGWLVSAYTYCGKSVKGFLPVHVRDEKW
jgi:hypothetical protein